MGKAKVWLNGKLIDSDKANVPIMTHSLQYGSAVFEGLRTYETAKGAAIFRLKDHVKRLENSAKIYSMNLNYTQKEIAEAIVSTVKANALKEAYIRPFIFYDDSKIGVTAYGKKTSVFVAAFPFGAYFGNKESSGIKCKISSWRRINSSILPVEAKASGNYLNSIIANTEAKMSGFDEAILLSGEAYIAEGSGENIFFVEDNVLVTPDKSSQILMGVTRDSIIKLAEAMGIEVEERKVHREEIYTCDELFFTGTAAEITPIINVDGTKIGKGVAGSITKMMAQKYSETVNGKNKQFESWLTYVK